MYDALTMSDLLDDEIEQQRMTGYDVSAIKRLRAELPPNADPAMRAELLDQLERVERTVDWPYAEPSDPVQIVLTLPVRPSAVLPPSLGRDVLEDKVLGGWQGRIAGCNLGKPVEDGLHWTRAHLRAYLQGVDAYPLTDYIPKDDVVSDRWQFNDSWPQTTRGRVQGSARDDDLDYSVLALHLLEKYGRAYTSPDVAEEWLTLLPFYQTYTAERVALRNLIGGLRAPETASYRNPYREWIGAQIRADVFGWVNPGDPRAAAVSTLPDATLSHCGNGIYGEMWAAALVASAFAASSARDAIEQSLHHVPPRSRLAEAVRNVLRWHASGLSWDAAMDELDAAYGHYPWVHTVNNAAAVTAGLLWADGDFTGSIGLTVQAGMDTDSNGATAGSVAGVLGGARGIPGHWVDPLEDRLTTAVFGYNNISISGLAARTVDLAVGEAAQL